MSAKNDPNIQEFCHLKNKVNNMAKSIVTCNSCEELDALTKRDEHSIWEFINFNQQVSDR